MKTSAHSDLVDWSLVADQHFEDIEELNELVQGWDFEFHQLKAGRSPAELLQFGRSEFMLSCFYFEQPYQGVTRRPRQLRRDWLAEIRIVGGISRV